jgi:hypothetical protein
MREDEGMKSRGFASCRSFRLEISKLNLKVLEVFLENFPKLFYKRRRPSGKNIFMTIWLMQRNKCHGPLEDK